MAPRPARISPVAVQAFRALQAGRYGQAASLYRQAATKHVSGQISSATNRLLKQTHKGLTDAAKSGVKIAKSILGIKPERKPRQHKGPVTPQMLDPGSKTEGSFSLKRGKKGGMYYINSAGKKVYVR